MEKNEMSTISPDEFLRNELPVISNYLDKITTNLHSDFITNLFKASCLYLTNRAIGAEWDNKHSSQNPDTSKMINVEYVTELKEHLGMLVYMLPSTKKYQHALQLHIYKALWAADKISNDLE